MSAKRTVPLALCALALATTMPRRAHAVGTEKTIAVQVGGSLLDQPTLALGVEGGIRWRPYGLLAKLEWNPWLNTQTGDVDRGVVNIGVGGEYTYFEGRARTAAFVGPSILAFRTQLDERPGTTGVFLEVLPVTLRWSIRHRMLLRVDPISFHFVAPVLRGIPLVIIEYRHGVSVEWTF